MADASPNEKSDARPKRSRMSPLENEKGPAVKPLYSCWNNDTKFKIPKLNFQQIGNQVPMYHPASARNKNSIQQKLSARGAIRFQNVQGDMHE